MSNIIPLKVDSRTGVITQFSKGDVIPIEYIDFSPLFPNLDSNPALKKIFFGEGKKIARKLKIVELKKRRQEERQKKLANRKTKRVSSE